MWPHAARSGVPLFEPNPDRESIKPYRLNPESLDVPIMCNPGTKEGVTVKTGRFARVWPANQKFFEKVRGAGGLVGIAVDPYLLMNAETKDTWLFRGSMNA